MIRLRQVVIAARDLDATVDQLCTGLQLTVCFKDPGVAAFGLHNALMVVGDQFIEVVSPIEDNTAAERLLDRRRADVSAYMVMFEVDDLDSRMAAIDAAGIRTVWRGDHDAIRGRHLHPADTGGAIVSLDQPSSPGGWMWAGPDWQAHHDNAAVTAIAGYTLAVDDPAKVAARWGELGLRHGVRFVGGTRSEIELVSADRNMVGPKFSLDQVDIRLV